MLIINPGTGAVKDATEELAIKAVKKLLEDAGHSSATIDRDPDDDRNGRFSFVLSTEQGQCWVDMPGIEIEKVRYMGESGQNIWDFPRLYVDGSSWVWSFAIGFVSDALNGKTESEEE